MRKNGIIHRIGDYFATPSGQAMFNFAYSFGAAIVILGALFKLLHLPFADLMLGVGMGVEALIFILSAFDRSVITSTPVQTTSRSETVSHETISGLPDLSLLSAQVNQLQQAVMSLTQASQGLLQSYQEEGVASERLGQVTVNYVEQMDVLNRQVAGLSAIYEIQLKGVSAQLETFEKVNQGLGQIRQLYDNTALDGFKIRQETERMSANLAELNKHYERMLAAMSANLQPPLN